MERHGKPLTRKSRTHQVFVSEIAGAFDVVSGSSEKTYTVRELSDGRFWCGCKWHEYHTFGECSHVLAVRQWLAQAGNRAVYAYSSMEEAKNAHRKIEDRNDGVTIASRKAAPKVQVTAIRSTLVDELFGDETQQEKDTAIPVQATRGRSKLFKC